MTDPARRSSFYGWFIWSVGAVTFAYAFVHRVAPAVMFDQLMRDFTAGAAVLGNLSACYFYAYAAMQVPVGLLVDRWGPRPLLTAAALIAGLGSLLFGSAGSLEAAYAGRLLIGLGSGAVFICTLTLAMTWLPRERFALAIGLTQTIAMLGAVAGLAPLGALVEALGWRAVVLGGGWLGFALAAVIWLIVRERKNLAPAAARAPRQPVRQSLAAVLQRRQTWLVCLYSALSSGPQLTFAVLWGVPYLVQAHGLSRVAAGGSASLMLVGWAIGAPTLGWLSDRIGRRKPVLLVCPVVMLASWCLLLYLPALSAVARDLLIFVIGASSSSFALTFALGRELNPVATAGLATSLVNFASIAAGAALQPLVGWLLDLQWQGVMVDGARLFTPEAYTAAFSLFPALMAALLLCGLFIKETHCRQAVE